MPRKKTESVCKVCGAISTVAHHSATGANGLIYVYEKFTHKNGIVHYFRSGKKTQKKGISDLFVEMVETKMNDGKFRFKEIKTLFESVCGSFISNTVLYRNIERAIRANLIQKRTENGIILYSRKIQGEPIKQLKIKETFLNYIITGKSITMTALLRFDNVNERVLTRIPVALPVGSVDSLDSLDMQFFDQMGSISSDNIEIAYSFSGQTGISINFNKPLKSSESNYIFFDCSFKIREDFLKFSLPMTTESLKIRVVSREDMNISVRKRLLDGIKETNPDETQKGAIRDGRAFTEVEFINAIQGEAIVVSW